MAVDLGTAAAGNLHATLTRLIAAKAAAQCKQTACTHQIVCVNMCVSIDLRIHIYKRTQTKK